MVCGTLRNAYFAWLKQCLMVYTCRVLYMHDINWCLDAHSELIHADPRL